MSRHHAPLRDRLRSIDAGRAERQTQLIAALTARAVDDDTLTARVAFERDRRAAAAWIRFRADGAPVYLAPLLVDGALARLARGHEGPDPAVAAALLARIEPLVVAIEAALGAELFPDGLDTSDPSDSILLRIDAHGAGGAVRHRLLVAFPPEGPVAAPVLPPVIPSSLGALRWRWTATFNGPPLRAIRVATIRAGDMMLLGLRPLVARVKLPGRGPAVAGRIDLIRGNMTLQNDIVEDPAAGREPIAPASDTQPIDWDELRVPTVIEIDGAMVSASEVAALGGGSVLPLPAGNGTLAVRVIAGGTLIGSGELVAVGEGFGVLFTTVVADNETKS
ncbi:FliM/FliN family flagellar motor switch protein [Sphingomonas sp. SUN019]|uniref:FliM/FliN family flagellar motor switch protein n=1 Tax=Sphingomonas sp. SUN019 TaxID=2937788 RepID=UPI002164D1A2|nr:FliM/FliN family flagellar motor switch protein [Sphingomonas sp. SUN019]UVO50024.1 FliM/FliN family flagellar motor switch protein [Sphingomonas sp. SUN019]